MSNIYLDRSGADSQVQTIQTQIEALQGAADQINSAMMQLQEVWKGSSADKAQQTYDAEYKTLLTQTIPNTVEEFKNFINGCVQAIFDTDAQLSGS